MKRTRILKIEQIQTDFWLCKSGQSLKSVFLTLPCRRHTSK
jgi:hypothetical protein